MIFMDNSVKTLRVDWNSIDFTLRVQEVPKKNTARVFLSKW